MSTNNTVGNPAWEKGVSANPSGRPKGVPNKATIKIKDAYAELIANNLDRIQSLLDRVAVTDPKGALDLLIRLSPFVIPKNVSQEITFESPIQIVIPKKPEEKD
jgi:nitrogen-specific signal transduction histidine kinase